MTREPLSVRPDQPVFEAANILYTQRFGCLPVVENGELLGIVTTTDMLRLLVRMMTDQGLIPGSSST
jgi:CBS domain-containing protein